MPKEKPAEEKLKDLAKRLRSGASVLHPVTERELAAVREDVKQQEFEKEREQERDRGR